MTEIVQPREVPYRPSESVVEIQTVGNGPRERVRWGAIWAGLVTAIAGFLLLSAAAVAVGAQVVSGTADADEAGLAGGIASALIALLAFFVGGYVAARASGVIGRAYGALNGFLVWGLGMVVVLALAAFGLGSLFGASGDLFAQYQQMGQPRPEGVDPNSVLDGIRNGSLGAFVAMILPAVAATVGGWLGSRDDTTVVTD